MLTKAIKTFVIVIRLIILKRYMKRTVHNVY